MTVAVVAIVLAQAAVLAFLVWTRRRDTVELIALCDRLCQRLQAPDHAILEHDERSRLWRSDEYAPPAVPPDDDQAFWMSRDKLANFLAEQETRGD